MRLLITLAVSFVCNVYLVCIGENTFQFHPSVYEDESNMCYKNETLNVTVSVTKLKVYKEYTTLVVVNKFPPWVQEERLVRKPVIENKVLPVIRLVGECCDGYQIMRQNKCEPICSINCGSQDDCIEPNNCIHCKPGFLLPLCDICIEGYEKIEEKCVPICSEQCVSQNDCLAPDQCVKCNIGFNGSLCLPDCPVGFYSKYCNMSCNCPTDGQFECNSDIGCICKKDYSGVNCDIPLVSHRIRDNISVDESRNAAFIPMIVTILFIAIVLMIVLYYRRKVALMKKVLEDRNHIDNNSEYSTSSSYIKNFFNPVYNSSSSIVGMFGKQYSTFKLNHSGKETQDLNNMDTNLPKKIENTDIHVYYTIENDKSDHIYEQIQKHADKKYPEPEWIVQCNSR